jgi:hypothetical protein
LFTSGSESCSASVLYQYDILLTSVSDMKTLDPLAPDDFFRAASYSLNVREKKTPFNIIHLSVHSDSDYMGIGAQHK